MTDADILHSTDPEEAFAVLADETRLDILQALWNPGKTWGGGETKRFSELRDAVGMRDSGQFNYHLDKLRDRFVRKTEAGYELTLAGRQIVGAIHNGSYTMDGSIEPIPLDEPCPSCDGSMVFHYENERMRMQCDDCDLQLTSGVPPGVFEDVDRGEFPAVASRYLWTTLQQVDNGFCWYCEGQMARDLVPVRDLVPPSQEDPDLDGDMPMARYHCTRCGADMTNDLGSSLLTEAEVVSFLTDHGIDIHGPDWWHLNLLDGGDVTFLDEAETRAEAVYDLEGERLRVVVDDDLEVLETERRAD